MAVLYRARENAAPATSGQPGLDNPLQKPVLIAQLCVDQVQSL